MLLAFSGLLGCAPVVGQHGLFVLVPDRALAEVVLRTDPAQRFNWRAAAHAEFARRARSGAVASELLLAMIRRSGVLTPERVEFGILDPFGRPVEGVEPPTRPGYFYHLPPLCGSLSLEFAFDPGMFAEVGRRLVMEEDDCEAEGAVDRFLATAPAAEVSRFVSSGNAWTCGTGLPGPRVFRGVAPERLRVRARVLGAMGDGDLGWFWVDMVTPAERAGETRLVAR